MLGHTAMEFFCSKHCVMLGKTNVRTNYHKFFSDVRVHVCDEHRRDQMLRIV
ncbi:MAG: hypothetical protein RIS46_594 [Actinomycetota bacterium]|jgi:hypothetical protein